jgi:hypothetical protein
MAIKQSEWRAEILINVKLLQDLFRRNKAEKGYNHKICDISKTEPSTLILYTFFNNMIFLFINDYMYCIITYYFELFILYIITLFMYLYKEVLVYTDFILV